MIAVEPNIESNDRFALMSLPDALKQGDGVAILVKHRQFVDLAATGALNAVTVLDFCGVKGIVPPIQTGLN